MCLDFAPVRDASGVAKASLTGAESRPWGLAGGLVSAYGPLMHELAIMASVVDAVLERLPGRQIASVTLEVGRVSGIEPDALRFCFELVTSGTGLEGAELEIMEPSARAQCRSCGTEFEVSSRILLCECGSADVRLDGGDQLAIRSVRMAA
jgi:hydrogenase nickel incorporation protein HypA/HybF